MFKVGLVEFDVGHFDQGSSYGDQTVYRVEVDPGTLTATLLLDCQYGSTNFRRDGINV